MIKRRRISQILPLAFIFVTFFSSLVIIYQYLSIPSAQSEFEKHLKEINHLEERIHGLEVSIQRHQSSLSQIKDSIKEVFKEDVPALNELRNKSIIPSPIESAFAVPPAPKFDKVKPNSDIVPYEERTIRFEAGKCGVPRLSANVTEINMYDVYDSLPFDNVDGGVWKQGFALTADDAKYTKEKPLKVFLVPHSHNDPGWLKTFEQYFTMQTKKIFDSMIVKMQANSQVKFIWAEISYLSLWWDSASEEKRDAMKKLILDGRIEIVNGGWVMPDEASSDIYALIDQLVEGHEWLKVHFGGKIVPRNAWTIDPFGLSPTQTYVFKRSGMKTLTIQRVHYAVKKYLATQHNLEFYWRQQWDYGTQTDLFTHMMPFYSYDIPHSCGPDPAICCQFDFRRLPGVKNKPKVSCPWRKAPVEITTSNINERAMTLVDQFKKKASLFKTNNVMIPLGDDFRWESNYEWDAQVNNFDKLIQYINSNSPAVQVQWATLNDYFSSVLDEFGHGNEEVAALSGDFFTYADRDKDYWSGYFTSRPFYKHMDRLAESRLRAAELAFTAASAKTASPKFNISEIYVKLVKARRNLALFQHHDGITGTAKNLVVNDYGYKLQQTITWCNEVMNHSISSLVFEPEEGEKPVLEKDDYFPAQDQPASKNVLIFTAKENTRMVVLYNSLAYPKDETVKVRISWPYIDVHKSNDDENSVPCQVNPVFDPETSEEAVTTEFNLYFTAHLPAYGTSVYTIRRYEKDSKFPSTVCAVPRIDIYKKGSQAKLSVSSGPFSMTKQEKSTQDSFSIKNSFVKITGDMKFGHLRTIESLSESKVFPVGSSFWSYGTVSGSRGGSKSGAYLFLPDGEAKEVVTEPEIIRIIQGPQYSEVMTIKNHVTHCLKLYNSPGVDGHALEIENVVDITETFNFELVMRLNSSVKNIGREFFTDLNGFQIIRRRTLDKLPLQANVYPLPSAFFIQDVDTRLTLLSAQPLGGSSLKQGNVDVFLDRRLKQDDSRGLGQGVLDNRAQTYSRFRLLIESSPRQLEKTHHPYLSIMAHHVSQSLLHPINVFFAKHNTNIKVNHDFSALKRGLPCDMHLMNFRMETLVEDAGKIPILGTSALMLLQRVGADCSFPIYGGICDTNGGKIDVNEILQPLKTTNSFKIEAKNFSPLDNGTLVASGNVTTFMPMEILAYRVSLY